MLRTADLGQVEEKLLELSVSSKHSIREEFEDFARTAGIQIRD